MCFNLLIYKSKWAWSTKNRTQQALCALNTGKTNPRRCAGHYPTVFFVVFFRKWATHVFHAIRTDLITPLSASETWQQCGISFGWYHTNALVCPLATGLARRNGPWVWPDTCLLYTSPSPRDDMQSRMPSSA